MTRPGQDRSDETAAAAGSTTGAPAADQTFGPGVHVAVPGNPRSGYTRGELTVHHTRAGIHAVTAALRRTGRQVVLVPTMGALHPGHLALVEAARRTPGAVVCVSIFVNPLQFGPGEDLDAYPRTLGADVAALAEAGAELVFAPSAAEMYPDGPRTTVHPGPAALTLEGAQRPGHFAGMLTVVAKLFGIVAPDVAFFGEKDYQQLVLIKQMVADLDLPVTVHGVPTVRESDGLAMSSRNRFLDAGRREAATVLSAALVAGAHAAAGGAEAVLSAAREVLATRSDVDVDYLELRAPDLGEPPAEGPARLLVAARLGATRLLDNAGVALGTGFLEQAVRDVAAQQAELADEIPGRDA